MKQTAKPLLALLLTALLLVGAAVPALAAEPGVYPVLDSWERIGSDPHVTMEKNGSGTSFNWLLTYAAPSTDRFEQTFVSVAPGTYDMLLLCNGPEAATAELTVNGQAYTWQEPQESLVSHKFTVNVPTQRNVRVSLRLEGTGEMRFIGPGLIRTGDPTPEPQENLLQNPGFESGFSPWVQQGAPNAFVTDAVAKTGINGLCLGYFASEGMVNYVEQALPAEAGTYEGSVSIKTDATLTGVGAVLMLEARDISGKVLASAASPAVSSSGGWQETSAALKAPAGTAQLVVKLGGIYCTGAFYMDDVSLIKSE